MIDIGKVSAELKKVGITLTESQIHKIANCEIMDETGFINKIIKLVGVILQMEGDNDVKRGAYRFLSRLDDDPVLNCLRDNKAYFDVLKDKLTLYERTSMCLDASLVGATHVAETLFDNVDCNPKNNTYLISYAMCSDNIAWVKALVEKWGVNIVEPDYCFLVYAKLLKNTELQTFYDKASRNKLATSSSSSATSSGAFFHSPVAPDPVAISKKERPIPSEIRGELLESFCEILLGELEMLADIKDEDTKSLLISAIFDPALSTSYVAQYACALDPVIGKRFAILYCCMYPAKWEEPFIKDFKNSLLDSYVERSFDEKNSNKDASIQRKKLNWLKLYGNTLLRDFFKERSISRPTLTSAQIQKDSALKQELLTNEDGNNDLSIEIGAIEDEKKSLEKIINDENVGMTQINIQYDPKSMMHSLSDVASIENNAWKKLSSSDPRWNKIYALIKRTPNGHERSSEKMLRVLSAILYKEENKCRWRELPQHFPPQSTVRHYYYEWKSSGVLKDIKQMFLPPNTKTLVK